jgi:hypothetical protein
MVPRPAAPFVADSIPFDIMDVKANLGGFKGVAKSVTGVGGISDGTAEGPDPLCVAEPVDIVFTSTSAC